ncbi:MAG: SufD family Fe-S cluster assembly protein [Candidatus Freyrarchaeum guaymaensis]
MSDYKKRALNALNKPAAYGPDLNLEEYSRNVGKWEDTPISELPQEIQLGALSCGVTPRVRERAGTFFQIDHTVVTSDVQNQFEDKAEVMSTKEALDRYDWFKDYWWKLVPVDMDKYTALAELEWDHGYFIHVHEGEKITLPLQSCLFMANENVDQNVHNVIILEPDSEAQVITGCVVHPNLRKGLHVGVSEFYLKKGSKLTFTMIHNWKQNVDVRPRTSVLLEKDATFVNNYVLLKPVRSIQTFPTAHCKGDGSRAVFNSIVYASGGSYIDLGAKVILDGDETRADVSSRAIATDRSVVYARGVLVGNTPGSRAHLECNGLLLSDSASIHAIPELVGNVSGTELSHEAAVGKIAEEQVQYLMARGFSEQEANSLIIRGFMDIRVFGLPEFLEKEIQRAIDLTTKAL